MNFSFHTCGLEWLTFEETIDILAGIGYDACGPIVGHGCHLDPETITEGQKKAYRKQAKDRGIKFAVLNPWRVTGFATGVESGETERFYMKALDLAADMDASGVRFLPGAYAQGESAGWRAMIQVLKPLCHHAEQVGVDLLMHNHENQLIDTANGFELLRHHIGSDRLQINLDCANLAILMDDPCSAIRTFGDHLRQVRVKGMNNHYPFAQQCVPGAPGDIVDWEAVLRTLNEIGYRGYVELVHYAWFPPDFHERVFEWATDLATKVEA